MIERYTRPEMGAIWTLENRYRAWLKVELAICEAWSEAGKIPEEALAEIRARAAIDAPRIAEIEETTRHDVIAFLTSLEEKIGPAARFIHLGCTSSDIVDTANSLLIQEAGRILLKDIRDLMAVLRAIAMRHKGVPCMGRTHGVHAEPTSFGLKMVGYHVEFGRHRERLQAALAGLEVGKISGAVGTYAFLPPQVEKRALQILGLRPDPHSTQIVQRDRYAAFFCCLAILGGGMERLAVELRHLQRTEVLEAEEGFRKGQKGSSAMPHKKNPISAENVCGISRLLRGNALASLENQALWHERDISHSSVERVIMPDSTILADYALTRLGGILEGLVTHPERMAENMDLSHGLYFSQRLLTELVDGGMPRQKAYETVQKLAMKSWTEKIPFPELARDDAFLQNALGTEKLAQLFDIGFYLKHEDEIFARVFGSEELENSHAGK